MTPTPQGRDPAPDMDLPELTQAERRLCEAFPQGRHVVVSPGSEPGADAAGGESWGPERTIRAEVLRDLLLGEVRPPALLSISGAKIIGQLNLDFMQISFPGRRHSNPRASTSGCRTC
ncbi:hypothetical protein ACH347_39990 [Saccharopolyspora sp. 5N102]|uniref:hypothetical protein n=1 Tax=Saccharopolyspora sp. 5N102 TaxID=3375155 RepID=UPI00379B2092